MSMMRWIALGAMGVGFGAAGCSAGGVDLVGVARVAITQVPSDGSVGCITVTATGGTAVTQSFDVQPGQSTTFDLQDLPTGTVRFTGDAYAGACSAVTPASVPTWLGTPVITTVVTTAPVVVELAMVPNGQATVGVDFPDASCRDVGAPCFSGSECCSGACAGNACSASCPAGSANCGAGCIDLSSDPNNCGACGDVCPAGDVCSGGVCGCPGGGTTSITGTVYAPNGVDPLPLALVYVPTTAVAPFPAGVSCESCAAPPSGSPTVVAMTAPDGTFTLPNVPAGSNVPIVIQKNRWRRQLVIPTVTACTSNPQPSSGAGQLRLPRTSSEGDLPHIAFVTGGADTLECVLRKIGIADSEFSDPAGPGHVRFYLGSGTPGARYSPGTPSETALWSPAAMNQYDMVFFACQGGDYEKTLAQQQVLLNYANAGGRVFAAHYSYVWLYDVAPFSSTASWAVNSTSTFGADPGTGFINPGSARTSILAQWLETIGATTTMGQLPVSTLRHDFTGVLGPSLLWLSVNDPALGNVPLHFTFDTPVGAPVASQCGRVAYSDFHAEPSATTTGLTFPAECNAAAAMTPEEKMVEYMIFDLGDCMGH